MLRFNIKSVLSLSLIAIVAMFALTCNSCSAKKTGNTKTANGGDTTATLIRENKHVLHYEKYGQMPALSKYNFAQLPANQKNIQGIDGIFKLQNQPILNARYFGMLFTAFGNQYYLLDQNAAYEGRIKKGDAMPCYVLENGKPEKQLKLKYGGYDDPRSMMFSAIGVTDKYFIAIQESTLHCYDKSTLKFVKDIKIGKFVNEIAEVNGKIFAYSTIWGVSSKDGANINFYELDSKTLEVKNKKAIPLPRGANMTHFVPVSNFGVWSGGYFICDATRYYVRFYDFDDKLVSDLYYDCPTMNIDEEVAKKIDAFDNLDEYRIYMKDKVQKLAYIRGIKFIDNNSFIVMRQDADGVPCCDIWRMNGKNFSLLYADLILGNLADAKINSNFNVLNSLASGQLLSGGIAAVPCVDGSDFINNPVCKNGTYSDYYKSAQKQKNNYDKMSVFFYKYIGK